VQVNAPFERKNSRFTLLFEGYAMLLLQDVPRARASRLLRCDEKSLAVILTYWVHDAVNRMDLSDICSIAMDETSFRRGHKYVTVAIDAVRRRVFDVEPGRDKTAVKNVGEKLERNGGNTRSVYSVTSDMSVSYLSAVREVFPNAKQVLLKALDAVRKDEQKESGRKNFHTRLTNAICEGINAMIQAAKRKARGFHTFEGYAAMIYLVAGKLKLATPVLF